MKTLCIVQARMGSTRLPGKVLLAVNGMPLLGYEINRVRRAKKIDKIVVATTVNKEDRKIGELCRKFGVDCFYGSDNDVLDRYFQCVLKYSGYENIVRITGDCPLIDPKIIDEAVELFMKGRFDYASNVNPETYPDGMDVEIFTRRALEISAREAKLISEREHVTQYIRKNDRFKKGNLAAPEDFSKFRLTVDNPEDFEVVEFLMKNSGPESGYLDYVNVLKKNPGILLKNAHIGRNEGLKKSLKKDALIKKI